MSKNELIFIDTDGNQYRTSDEPVAEGGQGRVYLSDDKNIVIKTVLDEELIYEEYETLLDATSGIYINSKARIARPIVKLEKPEKGYVMRFLEGGKAIGSLMKFKASAVSEIMNEYNTNGGLKRRLLLLKDLAKTLHYIHTAGAVYGDISDKNVFISRMYANNPVDIKDLTQDNTKIHLIDADNLRVEHLDAALYTPGYGAPEVVKGNPNTAQSDMYSFALLSFVLLNINNPFDGVSQEEDCWDAEPSENANVEEGGKAFIYDRNDMSNHAGEGILPWQFGLTENMLSLFERAFGLQSRKKFKGRPSASEWFVALSEAVENVYFCKKCNAHHYYKCAPCKSNFKSYYAVVDDLSPCDEGYSVVHRRKIMLDGHTEIKDRRILVSALEDVSAIIIEPKEVDFIIDPCDGYEIEVFESEKKIETNTVNASNVLFITDIKRKAEYAIRITFERAQ
jgi:serine/threonine protein kinase